MTNQKYLKSFEMVDMLEAMNRNIKNGSDCGCIIDALTGDYTSCPEGTCRECIENWLKAEKEDYSL